MNDLASSSSCSVTETRRGRLVAGGVLLVVASAALVGPYLPPDWARHAFLPCLGLVFGVAAALARSRGLLVPAGVLLGVGVGAALQSLYGPAAFFFALAGGFLSIALLAAVLFRGQKQMWWPVFPAGGLALVGAIVSGGTEVSEIVRATQGLWPVVLLAVAVALIVSALRQPRS